MPSADKKASHALVFSLIVCGFCLSVHVRSLPHAIHLHAFVCEHVHVQEEG